MLKHIINYSYITAFKFLISKMANFMLRTIAVAMKYSKDDIVEEILVLAALNKTQRKIVLAVLRTLKG